MSRETAIEEGEYWRIVVRVDRRLLKALDEEVVRLDSDRSKVLRDCLRKFLGTNEATQEVLST